MPLLDPIALAALLLEDNDLVGLNMVEDLRLDLGALDDWLANGYRLSVNNKKNVVEGNRLVDIRVLQGDVKLILFGNFILLAGNIDYRVHGFLFFGAH